MTTGVETVPVNDPVGSVRVARRWRVRLISDQLDHRVGSAPMADFVLVLDRELELWVASWEDAERRYGRQASGPGLDLEVSGDLTLGQAHDVSVVVKPSDDTVARWQCTCGVSSRGTSTPERARIDGDEHAARKRRLAASRPRWTDVAVAQGTDGAWRQVTLKVVRRFRVTARSDFSRVKVHRSGVGEDFELAVDAGLGLWARRVGADAALRRDESGRGVTLVVLSDDA